MVSKPPVVCARSCVHFPRCRAKFGIIRILYYYFAWAIFLNSSVLAQVPPVTRPLLLIIGQDVSDSFNGYDLLRREHIDMICRAAEKADREIVIAFELIGTPNDRSFKRIHLQALPTISDDLSMTETANITAQRSAIAQRNHLLVLEFLQQCTGLLKTHRKESATDLNGFLKKANRLYLEPTFHNFHRIVYLHTDGLQDLGKQRTLEWTIGAPVRVFISGWSNNEATPKGTLFESPSGFVDYFQRNAKLL